MTERDIPSPRGNLMTPQEAASEIGVSPRTLHRYEARGLIKAQKLPRGHRRYAPEDVARLLATQSAESAAAAS